MYVVGPDDKGFTPPRAVPSEQIASSNFGSIQDWDDDFDARGICWDKEKKEWRIPCYGYGRDLEKASGHMSVFVVATKEEAVNSRRCPACEECWVFPDKRSKKRSKGPKDGKTVEEKDQEFADVCDALGLEPRKKQKSKKAQKTEQCNKDFDEAKDILGLK